MRKLQAILLAMALMTCLSLGAEPRERGINSLSLSALITEYSLKENFEVTRVPRIGVAFIRLASRFAADDEETEMVLNALRGIRKVTLVDYNSCSEDVSESFSRKVKRVLGKSEKLLEVKEEGDILQIYGLASEGSEWIRDMVVFSPTEGTLVCIYGRFSMDQVAALMSENIDI